METGSLKQIPDMVGTIGILASHTDTTIQLNVATVPPSLVVELVDWRPNNISVSDASQF